MEAAFRRNIETHLEFYLRQILKYCSFSLFLPLSFHSSNPYFLLFCSTCKSGFSVTKAPSRILEGIQLFPPPDEYLEAHCYHGNPARPKLNVALAGTNVEKMKRCPLKQVTTGLMQQYLVYRFILLW